MHLNGLGFIKKDEQGYFQLTDALISTGRLTADSSVQAMNVMGFQRVMVDLEKRPTIVSLQCARYVIAYAQRF